MTRPWISKLISDSLTKSPLMDERWRVFILENAENAEKSKMNVRRGRLIVPKENVLKQSVRVAWGGSIVADGYFSYWYVLTASFTGGVRLFSWA